MAPRQSFPPCGRPPLPLRTKPASGDRPSCVHRVCTLAGGTVHSLLSDGTDWVAIHIAHDRNRGMPISFETTAVSATGCQKALTGRPASQPATRAPNEAPRPKRVPRLRSALGSLAGAPRDGPGMSFAVRRCSNGYAGGSFTMPAPKKPGQPRVRRQPRSELGRWPLGPRIGAVPPLVHVTLVLHPAGRASQFEWRRPGPNPRVRSADPRRRICDSRRRSSRPRPDQSSPIDRAQGRARGQTTPPLARP